MIQEETASYFTKLGDSFKLREQIFRQQLDPNKITIIRLDGMRFHTFTKDFIYPFDPYLRLCLEQSLLEVIQKELKGYVALVYFQSDEASIILPPITNPEDKLPFGGRVEKLTAALLQWNVYFYRKLANISMIVKRQCPIIDVLLTKLNEIATKKEIPSSLLNFQQNDYINDILEAIYKNPPSFDCRFIQVDSIQEAEDYLSWRRMDAIRNFKSMLAYSLFSHKRVNQLSANERIELVRNEKGIDYNTFPVMIKRGNVYHTLKFKGWINDGFKEEDVISKTFRNEVLNSRFISRETWDLPNLGYILLGYRFHKDITQMYIVQGDDFYIYKNASLHIVSMKEFIEETKQIGYVPLLQASEDLSEIEKFMVEQFKKDLEYYARSKNN